MNLTLKVLWSDHTIMERAPFLLTGLSLSVKDIFKKASNNAINLEVELIERPYFNFPVSKLNLATLVEMGNTYVPNSEAIRNCSHSTEILAVIGSRFWSNPLMFGVMFDTGIKDDGIQYYRGRNNRPRECCSVFLDPLRDFARANGLSKDRLFSRTLVHEIGHIFNLHHPHYHESPSFMSRTSPNIPYKAFSSFTDKDKKRLRLIDSQDYRRFQPGTEEFARS